MPYVPQYNNDSVSAKRRGLTLPGVQRFPDNSTQFAQGARQRQVNAMQRMGSGGAPVPNPAGVVPMQQSAGIVSPFQQMQRAQVNDILNSGTIPQGSNGPISSFGQGLVNARRSGMPLSQPDNARGLGQWMPNPAGSGPVPGTSEGGLGYVDNIHGGRRRFYEGRGGRSMDTVDPNTGQVTRGNELGYTTGLGGQTVIGRTPNGGLSFTGTPGENAVASKEQKDYTTSQKDSRILRNARKYGLDSGIPAVAKALGRQADIARPKAIAAADEAAHQGRIEQLLAAQVEHHLEEAKKLGPAKGIPYLKAAMAELQAARPTIAKPGTSSKPGDGKKESDLYVAKHAAAWKAYYHGITPRDMPSLEQWPPAAKPPKAK